MPAFLMPKGYEHNMHINLSTLTLRLLHWWCKNFQTSLLMTSAKSRSLVHITHYIIILSSCKMRSSFLYPFWETGDEWSRPDVQKLFAYWKPGGDISTFISNIFNLLLSRKVWLHLRHMHTPEGEETSASSIWYNNNKFLTFVHREPLFRNLGKCMY